MSKNLSPAELAAQDLDKAANEENPPNEEETNDPPNNEDNDPPDSDDDTNTNDNDSDVDDNEESEEDIAARNLYRNLNDPTVGPAIIEQLAKRMGLKIEGASKTEQRDIVDSIESLVKEELGPEFQIFAGKLSN